ncbi:MAG: hypothetical protein OEV28_12900 [Nitrospirota bacterium]|nr:hypothetical protein [Nitrospirota bacterium]
MRQRISEWAYINKWLALEMSGATLLTTIVIMLFSVPMGSGWVIAGAVLSAALHLFTKDLFSFSVQGIEDEAEGHENNHPKWHRRMKSK